MSAFAAVITVDGPPLAPAVLARLRAELARAPHDDLNAVAVAPRDSDAPRGGVAMVHALMTTREGARCGPHRSARGVLLTGNVRVDAQRELREALRVAGVRPPAIGDDEGLLLAAWEAWGEEMLTRVLGDYAFVLWDPGAGRGLVARDALGIRPVYWASIRGGIVASSSIDAVRAHPDVSNGLDDAWIASTLAVGYATDATRTVFADVHRLASGSSIALGGPSIRRRVWWQPPSPAPSRRSDREVIAEFHAVLGDAVADRMRLPEVVIPLSGGLDSPSLTATARRVRPGVDVTSVTIAGPDAMDDPEPPLARRVAQRLGTRHVVTTFGYSGMRVDEIPRERLPEPTNSVSNGRELRIVAAMAAHGRVQLNGEDGDGLLLPSSFAEERRRFGTVRTIARLARFAVQSGRKPHTGLRLREWWSPPEVEPPAPAWLAARWRDAAARAVPLPCHDMTALVRPDTVARVTHPFFQMVTQPDFGVLGALRHEVAWPLMDLRLLGLVMSLPTTPWLQRKELLRRAFRGTLPDEVLRRPKTPVRTPSSSIVATWRAEQGAHPPTVSDRVSRWVDPAQVNTALAGTATDAIDHAWRVLALDNWLRAGIP